MGQILLYNNRALAFDSMSETPYTSINVVEITGNTTYNKPSNLLYARVVCLGGGGGGGSGRITNLSTVAGGGGGGQGGCLASRVLLESDINPTGETITIGTGGTGGPARQNVANQSGQAGGNGALTSFGSLIIAAGGIGGPPGGGGLPTNRTILNCTPNLFQLAIPGATVIGQSTTAAGNNASQNHYLILGGGCNAGSGSGKTAAGVAGNGGLGGRSYDKDGVLSAEILGGLTGSTGNNGLDNVSLQILEEFPISGQTLLNTIGIGTGGSGGGSSVTDGVPGAAGGNGGLYGAGGAGGGAGLIGVVPNGSGKGGDGSRGFCIIVEYLA
jgi:hypothetical protein